MVGKKGRSGRKPRTDGKKMRAVNLYIPMYELERLNGKGFDWHPEAWFKQFKRIFGSRWQEQVRNLMLQRVSQYEHENMWQCDCKSRLQKWHFKHEAMCPRCEYEPYDLQRYKTQAMARIYSKENNRPDLKPLNKCPSCGKPLSFSLDIKGNKVLKCEVC